MLKKIQISFLKLHKKPLACFSQYPLKIYKAAVILSGSGVADGSEIIESASLLVSLSKIGAKIQCYAPNKLQKDVIDHTNGQTLKESRNVLVESARICRGNIKDILELNSKEYQALFLPGGFGAAKNWSNFSDLGPDFIVNEQIERVLLSFYNDKKPIAACCITPIILAKVFGKYQVKLTLGKSTNEWEFAGTIGNFIYFL